MAGNDKTTGNDINQLYMKDTSFANLMQKRIFNVLLIASRYDAFTLEEDGRVEEHIFLEYMSLNLSSPPRVKQVSDVDDALAELTSRHYDLIIAMPPMQNNEMFRSLKELKARYPEIPVALLTPFSHEVSRRLENEDLSGVDYAFSWLGNADLLLAIVKLIEDKMNVKEDVASVGVQVILLVEDSIRFYSSLLPILYKLVLKQSQIFSTEALNRHEQMLRMRGRPKILLARNYEEAKTIYDKFSNNILGVVTDVSFMREGKKDQEAGLKLCRYLRSKDENLPIIIDSSDLENQKCAITFNAAFLYKHSKTLPVDLKNAVLRNFGYSDFEFIQPQTGEVVATVKKSERPAKRNLQHPRRFPPLPCLAQSNIQLALFKGNVPAGRDTETKACSRKYRCIRNKATYIRRNSQISQNEEQRNRRDIRTQPFRQIFQFCPNRTRLARRQRTRTCIYRHVDKAASCAFELPGRFSVDTQNRGAVYRHLR